MFLTKDLTNLSTDNGQFGFVVDIQTTISINFGGHGVIRSTKITQYFITTKTNLRSRLIEIVIRFTVVQNVGHKTETKT